MDVRFTSVNEITTTVSFRPEQLNLTNAELFVLIDRALGHKISKREICGLHEDETEYTESYGDKADKELLRLIKLRLEKEEHELNPTSHTWSV